MNNTIAIILDVSRYIFFILAVVLFIVAKFKSKKRSKTILYVCAAICLVITIVFIPLHFNFAKKADLDKRFGNISLSDEEIKKSAKGFLGI